MDKGNFKKHVEFPSTITTRLVKASFPFALIDENFATISESMSCGIGS